MTYITCCLIALPFGTPAIEESSYETALLAAVHRFAREGELAHLKAIVEKHPDLADVRQQFPRPRRGIPCVTDGYTPLMHAARHGHKHVVAYLIERGADVNYADGIGWTALHLAAQEGRLDIVQMLVRQGAKIDAKTREIPAGLAINADAPVGDEPGEICPAIPPLTPFDLALHAKRAEVVEYLKSVKK